MLVRPLAVEEWYYMTKFGTMEINSLSSVIEESRFISLNNHNVKQLPPVLPYNVAHSSVAITDKRSEGQQLVVRVTALRTRNNMCITWGT